MRDLTSFILMNECIRPQVATGAVNGQTVDTRGYDSAMVVVTVGAITGAAGDATVILQESDDASAWSAVAATDILGTQPTLAANTAAQFGYIGAKRYVRAVFGLGGETNVAVAAAVLLGHPDHTPA